MPLTPDTVLENRYRVDRLLGQGGMGAVYRAWDTRLEQWVALKENAFVTVDARAQFEREAKILARLHHTNLPKVIDHFITAEGLQYLVMTYVDGVNLAELLAARGRQSPDSVMAWLGQVCDALVYLHNQNPPVIHRDIKPQNIKITPEGRAVLVDFGLSKVGVQQRTATGAIGFTPGFSPPEQYGNNAHTDQTSDVYALTATLYTMLTGAAPPESVQRSIGRAALPLPRQVNPSIPAALEQAILAGLETQPDRRTPTVAALRQQVTAALSRGAVSAPNNTAAPPTTLLPRSTPARASGRPWVLIVMGTLVAMLLIALILLAGRNFGATPNTPTSADVAHIDAIQSLTNTLVPTITEVKPSPTPRQPVAATLRLTTVSPTATMRPTPAPTATSVPPAQPRVSPEQIIAVSLAKVANANTTNGYVDPPRGNVVFAGVNFYLGQGESITTQAASLPTHPTRIFIPVNVNRPEAVYLMLTGGNLFSRFAGQTVGQIRLVFDSDQAHAIDLVAGQNLREWKQFGDVLTRTTSPDLTEVWRGANRFDSGPAVIDILRVTLPAELQSEHMVAVEVLDLSTETVGDLDPALNVLSLSIAQKPVPPAAPTEVVCRVATADPFQTLWQQQRTQLGCALNQPAFIDAATQRFEHGRMIWRKNNDMIYVLYDDGDWAAYPDTSVDGAPEPEGFEPPAGLYTPVRGFGTIWRTELGGSIARIGWATETEYGLPIQFQDFEQGFMLEMEGKVYAVGANGERWIAQ